MASDLVNQYVNEIISFSSELSNDQNSASNLRGAPKALNSYGKKTQCWSPSSFNQEEYVEIKFEQAVFATGMKIYENYNAGSVVKIEVSNEGTYETLWSRQRPQLITQYTIFQPKFTKSRVRSNQYRITFRYLSSQTDYSQIDSIELIGTLTNIYATDKTLADDIPKLLSDTRFCDLKIFFKNDTEHLNAHQNIFVVRCPQILDYLIANQFFINELTRSEFEIILDYIYTDQLNEIKLNDAIEDEKALVEEKLKSESQNSIFDTDKWALCLNKLIRFTIKYKFTALESLLNNYLMTKFINNDNVLVILIDAIQGTIDARKSNDFDVNLSDIIIDFVQFSCMEYIKSHASAIFESEKINLISKDILMKIVEYLAEHK